MQHFLSMSDLGLCFQRSSDLAVCVFCIQVVDLTASLTILHCKVVQQFSALLSVHSALTLCPVTNLWHDKVVSLQCA